MNLERFEHLLDIRGSNHAAWPKVERDAAGALLGENADARRALVLQQGLEQQLDQIEAPDFPGLEARILRQPLPPKAAFFADRIVNWLIPGGSPWTLWRPAFAACLPLVFGIVLSGWFSFGVGPQDPGFAYWDQELYLLSLYDYAETEATEVETANE